MAGQQIEVVLRRSMITEKPAIRQTVLALGLRRIGDRRLHADNPSVRGMVAKVIHLVTVIPQEGATNS